MDELLEEEDEDESYEPIVQKPSDPPPLKRLWVTPDTDDDAPTLPAPKSKRRPDDEPAPSPPAAPRKKKKKVVEEVIDDGTGAIKLEETPVLDTYEARQRVRLLIGVVLGVIGLTVLVLLLKAFKGNGTTEVTQDSEPPENRPAVVDSRAGVEQEAQIILDMAKQADKNGSSVAALETLKKLVRNYENTAASRDAMAAIDRAKRNRPLFGPDGPDQAPGPKPPDPAQLAADEAKKKAEGSPTPPVVAAPPPYTRPLPPGYRPKYDFPIHPTGWPTRISCDLDGAELVLVPASIFLMGRADGEPAERPEHQVDVSTYYIDKHEVTVGQYLRYLKETGRPIDSTRAQLPEDQPVVNISAREAKAYCNWANRRLPTEAQWELAARGPNVGKISYWNGELPRKDPEKGVRTIEPVMTLPTDLSPFGAFDMSANAWEWTSEFYNSQYYLQFRNVVKDPTGPKEAPGKIVFTTVKGGSKAGILTWREGQRTESRLPYLGFRGALPVEGAPIAPPAATPAPNGPGAAPSGGVQPF